MPATFVWTGAQDTNFDNAGNWNDVTDGLNPATTAPGAQDTAEFIMGGGTITGTGMVAGLLFGGTDPWVLSNGAQLTDTASFTDSGTLTIQSGAKITSSGNSTTTTINSGSASSTATLHVDGAGSSFAVTSGFAALTIGSQLLATDPTGIGSLVVTNGARPGSRVTFSLALHPTTAASRSMAAQASKSARRVTALTAPSR